MTLGVTASAHSAPQREPASGPDTTAASESSGVPERQWSRAVTLITGDRIRVDDKGRVIGIRRAKGREGTPISVHTLDGRMYAIPVDAQPLIARGTLDQRLFDVTGLIEGRYDDAHRRGTPLIVTYTSEARGKSAVAAADASVRRSLPVVNGEAVTVPKSSAPDVWEALTAPGTGGRTHTRTVAPGIERVWLDGQRKASLDRSVPQIGAPDAWQAGYDGEGVKIAVLDTGVDQTHPDLAGVEIAEKNFSQADSPEDHVGHGTHVASTAAGSGAKSGGKYKGVAPGARILDGKVLADDGSGQESGIIAGMQWAVEQGAQIVNLSLGGRDTPETDPLEEAVDKLSTDTGVLFVIAGGNSGPDSATINSPGSAEAALTVGAVDREDAIARFSSAGPTADGGLKPDITAPGVGIVAAKAAEGQVGDPAADGYVSLSGTSMATPHVAGAAALLAQQHPDWTGEQIKQALAASAKPGAGLTALQQGTGRTDLTRAVVQNVVTEQTSVNFGFQQWPHDDDKPVTQKITYRNHGKDPVTLDLSVRTTGPDGEPGPEGMFTVAPGHVTVPAGGTAAVDVTADTRTGTLTGVFSGALVATAESSGGPGNPGGQSVRTAVAVEREAESYNLTINAIDNEGRPAHALTDVFGLTVDAWERPEDADNDGTVKLRLPKGVYSLSVPVITPGDPAEPEIISLLVQPEMSLDKDTTLTFDGRKAEPVEITAPDSAVLEEANLSYSQSMPGGRGQGVTWRLGSSFKDFTVGHAGASVPADRFRASVAGAWANDDARYHLFYSRTGSLFTGFAHEVSTDELALVSATIGEPAEGKSASFQTLYSRDDSSARMSAGGSGAGVDAAGAGAGAGAGVSIGADRSALAGLQLPAVAKKYYLTTPKGYTWRLNVVQFDAAGQLEAIMSSSPTAYKPGKTYRSTFNVGVFGPAVGTAADGSGASRQGDEMRFCVPMFADGAGHQGSSLTTEARTVITAGGRTIFDRGSLPCPYDVLRLPTEESEVRITSEVARSEKLSGVSTRIVADWTYKSRSPGDKEIAEPVSTVRFSPKLTLTSDAKAGSKARVPLVVEGPAAGKGVTGLKSLKVKVSYDGGKTWKNTRVHGKTGKLHLKLRHPKSAKSVSFKAKLTDYQGSIHSLTIYSAYRLVS